MSKFDPRRHELDAALWGLRDRLVPIVVFSFFINLLQLAPTIYMLQLSERVLSSRDPGTLVALSGMVLYLYLVTTVLEYVRSHLLVRLGLRVDEALRDRVFEASFRAVLARPGTQAAQPLNDLVQLRQFVGGSGLLAFADAPWILIFLAMIVVLHPLLGALAVCGAGALYAMTYATERLTQKPLSHANAAFAKSQAFAAGALRNAQAAGAMGMLDSLRERWMAQYASVLGLQTTASDRGGSIGSGTRFLRIALQSAMLGTGAFLAIEGHVTAGAMFAGSILIGRMLSPVELGIANWKGFVAARDARERLAALLEAFPPLPKTMDLPAPKGAVQVESLVVAAPESNVQILKGVAFAANAGEIVAVIGPSASGKSTLARALVGVWPALAGKVRLDGSDVHAWDRTKLGPHVGYLPQDVELFAGTIAENIARMGEPDSKLVIAAAKSAGLHDMFLRLPKGYDTHLGEEGGVLSAGQRQRVGLARALYGEPALLVLDEPNSNLDDAGDAALMHALLAHKKAGKTAFVVTHRTNVVAAADRILVLRDGRVAAYGLRDEVLAAMRAPKAAPKP